MRTCWRLCEIKNRTIIHFKARSFYFDSLPDSFFFLLKYFNIIQRMEKWSYSFCTKIQTFVETLKKFFLRLNPLRFGRLKFSLYNDPLNLDVPFFFRYFFELWVSDRNLRDPATSSSRCRVIRNSIKLREKIVPEVLKDRCEGETLIFETVAEI